MVKKRRRHSAAYKFRIALEALEGSKTISQLSSEHEIHPNMIRAWKRQLLEDGPSVFASNGKRVRRLMRLMGIQAIYPGRSSSSPGKGHKRYPYLLRNLPITHVNQVWSADITYVPLLRGFTYLVAVIDWHSRYVLAWQLSNTLDGGFCLDALRQALVKGRPKIFNTDQGAQFTADAFTACLLAADIRVSMDGRGRALDNVFCERLWRSVKYENIYLNQYDTVRQLDAGLSAYFDFYNHERPHQSLNYRTPAEEHFVLCSEPAAFA